MRVESTVLSSRLSIALQRSNAAAEGGHEDGQALRDGLRVSLSALGQYVADAGRWFFNGLLKKAVSRIR